MIHCWVDEKLLAIKQHANETKIEKSLMFSGDSKRPPVGPPIIVSIEFDRDIDIDIVVGVEIGSSNDPSSDIANDLAVENG